MSDSHGNDESVRYIISHNPDADLFIHCGDVQTDHHQFENLMAVKGNHDYEPYNADLDEEIILEIYNHRLLIFHSHTLEADYDDYFKIISDYGKKRNCDIVIFGHLHVKCDILNDGIRLISPGSLLFNFSLDCIGYDIIDFNDDGSYEVKFISLPDCFQLKE